MFCIGLTLLASLAQNELLKLNKTNKLCLDSLIVYPGCLVVP